MSGGRGFIMSFAANTRCLGFTDYSALMVFPNERHFKSIILINKKMYPTAFSDFITSIRNQIKLEISYIKPAGIKFRPLFPQKLKKDCNSKDLPYPASVLC